MNLFLLRKKSFTLTYSIKYNCFMILFMKFDGDKLNLILMFLKNNFTQSNYRFANWKKRYVINS
jgi:hypothetical protein